MTESTLASIDKVNRSSSRRYVGRHAANTVSHRSWKKLLNAKLVLGLLLAAIMIIGWFFFPSDLNGDARTTLIVFGISVWLWVFSSIDDTYVALAASSALVLTGVISTKDFFDSLGETTTWLLIGAFIISVAVSNSGLALRGAVVVTSGVKSPRVLVHVLTLATVCTVFAVPATSGRAALILPVFLALAEVLKTKHAWLVVVLSLLFPVVVLLSAVGSFIGAGAHLITNQILAVNELDTFDFGQWLLLGLPLAVLTSHVAAEVIVLLMSNSRQRAEQLDLSVDAIAEHAGGHERITGALSSAEVRSLTVLVVAVVLWSTEAIHGIHPALVAVLGALLISSPVFGTVNLSDALKTVPWTLLLFMAATLAMSYALINSGAAHYIADHTFRVSGNKAASAVFIALVVVASTLAHLVIQSRSARSAVLIPIVIALAPAAGINPVAAAFISTAAAGFCHTLPASAKPLALFNRIDADVPVFNNTQLLRVALVLLPVHIVILLVFSLWVWPLFGMPLYL